MSNGGTFARALTATLAWEGIYSADPDDPGGETFCGIARKRWPQWPGWRLLDAQRGTSGFPSALATDPEMRRLVTAFYRAEFWMPLHGDDLPELLVVKTFDTAVNLGLERAVRLLQLALVTSGQRVAVDGVLGPETVAACRAAPVTVLAPLRSAQAGYYHGLMAARPGLSRFARGWERRALS